MYILELLSYKYNRTSINKNYIFVIKIEVNFNTFCIAIVLLVVCSCNLKQESGNLNCELKETNLSSVSKIAFKSIKSSKKESQNYIIQQLDNIKGLSNSSVNAIFQDSENFIWIGTWDGLNRYDGNRIKIFRPEPNDENSISNQVVLKIDEDNTGAIWILTMHGINRYDKRTNKFHRFYFSRKNIPPFSESEFNMAVDQSNTVFCAVKDWGTGYFYRGEFHVLDKSNLPTIAVKKMDFTPTGELLLLYEDNRLFSLVIEGDDSGAKLIIGNRLISEDVQDFGICSTNKIYVVSTLGDVKILHSLNQKSQSVHEQNVISVIGCIAEGLILSNKSEYFIVDSLGLRVEKPWLKYLQNQKVTTLYAGSENVLWTGTDGDGLFQMYPIRKSFNPITRDQIPDFNGGIVRTFSEVDENSFWIGTKGKGLFHFSSNFYQNQEESLKYENLNESNSSINNSVYILLKGQDDLMFIGTDGNGITVYDFKTSTLIDWTEIIGSEDCDFFKSVYTIYQDESGFIWIGTNGYGMIRFRIERLGEKLKITRFKKYLASSTTEGNLSSNIIFSIVPNNNNKLWIGTRLGGLNLFDKASEKFTAYKKEEGDAKSMSSNDVLCLHIDDGNRLWIGTSFGLNLLESIDNEGGAVFKNFNVKDGLPNNTIHGIVSDKHSNLWISTNFGLSNFIINESRFINYTKSEGLQNNEFADGAYFKSVTSDYIFMGGIKGFNYFLPSEISESTFVPDICIEKISGQNEEEPYLQNLVISPNSESKSSIVLKHNQNFFDIELTALTFINSEKCQYAYQLKNFNEVWNSIDNRKNISFTNVPPGKYSLWLKWSNSDGIWTKPLRAVDIQIQPIFWRSATAISMYSILFVLFLLFVFSYYKKRELLKRNIIFQKHEEEIHQNKLAFFTNIAHELQTPLTLIVGPSQKLSESASFSDDNRKFIHMIQRNSSRLLFLTQQLLEFRKAEFDHLEVSVKHFDLVSLIEQITELFDELALKNNIDFKLEIAPELVGWYDKDKIEKIVFNLLSNAFKYTPDDGEIKFCLIKSEGDINQLEMRVSNTGSGIPKEKLELVFDRFFLSGKGEDANTDKFRTGIGLAYVKRIVTVLRGEITVTGKTDELTTFKVVLPCSKSSFKNDEIGQEENVVLISHHLKNILGEPSSNTEDVPDKILILDSFLNKRKVVLVVEDEKEIQELLCDLLSDKYNVLTADDGAEALHTIEKEIPDIIISDIMMPNMDGIELCKKIKRDIKTCNVPIILLTSKGSVIHRIEGLESGANSYIPKPFYPDHLLAQVQNLIHEKELILKYFAQDTFDENLQDLPIKSEEKDFLRKVIQVIRDNIENENLQSSFIEKELGISTSQLYRKIKQTFGFSPGDLIRTTRLKHAAHLLQKNLLTVSEVCYQSGFNNRSYFYREFKKMFNSTPKNYQLKYQSKSVSPIHSTID